MLCPQEGYGMLAKGPCIHWSIAHLDCERLDRTLNEEQTEGFSPAASSFSPLKSGVNEVSDGSPAATCGWYQGCAQNTA
jgi:hypothetical protein